jgi:hypothetical protein
MVVFGGNLGSAADDGVWALSLTGAPAWTDLLGTGTPRIARGTQASIYDPANDRMVSFAGYDNAGATKNDVWALGFGATAGVEIPAAAGFSLLGVRPNPSSGHFSAWFTLPAAGPAQLEVLDVSGRRIAAREVGSLGAGSHSVDLTPQRPLSPGMYLLRLTREGRTATARAAVVR